MEKYIILVYGILVFTNIFWYLSFQRIINLFKEKERDHFNEIMKIKEEINNIKSWQEKQNKFNTMISRKW